jgi:sigma-B regulation protein RsbU (phosphoserine phosphatase)
MAQRVKQQHADLARLVTELREALAAKTELMGLQQQMAIAARMQEAILPKSFPPRKDVEIYGALLPAKEMDGDFYDFFPRPDGHIVIAAGEISGTGLAKAFMMLVARIMLKAMMLGEQEPGEVLARMDMMLAAENEESLAVRLFVGLLDPESGRLHFANAGYQAPLLLRRAGEVVNINVGLGQPLALGAASAIEAGVFDLPLRATMVLTSRGATDAADRFGRSLGRDGLMLALQATDDISAPAICEVVESAVLAIAPTSREADAACLAIRYLGG